MFEKVPMCVWNMFGSLEYLFYIKQDIKKFFMQDSFSILMKPEYILYIFVSLQSKCVF